MKNYQLAAFIIFCFLILNSCSAVLMINKNDIKPSTGKSIVYGNFFDLRGFGRSIDFSFYDRSQDKFFNFALTGSWDFRTNVYFAYELAPGTYELFKHTSSTYNGQSGSSYSIYWFKKHNPGNAGILKDRPFFGLNDDYMKKLEHDVIVIPTNQVIYIGDWMQGKQNPIVIDHKKETDAAITNEFPNLMVNQSISLVPVITD